VSQGPPTLPHTSRDARHLNALDFRFRVGCAAVDSSLSTAVVLGLPSPSVRLTLTAAAALLQRGSAASNNPCGWASQWYLLQGCVRRVSTHRSLRLLRCVPVPRFFLGPAAASCAASVTQNQLYLCKYE
jgi:hypothetical protein